MKKLHTKKSEAFSPSSLFSFLCFPVGLRLLLSPINSNVVVRTACCSTGIVLPVYSTFKAIENRDYFEQNKWLLYWTAYGTFNLTEGFADKILPWFPLYYHMKFAFLVWLQLPSTNGARQLYMDYLRPFLLRHQARLDQIMGLLYGEMNKIVSAHLAELQFVKALFLKILSSVRNTLLPWQGKGRRGMAGAATNNQDSQTDDED
ncbi:hypothetical protein K2173_002222 [Erythroxylum novogranatense]|uniref:HVA22-like protein n=1 Tax=Erythroxylum novogranatense TaxID=1862640 RepID=A0AAV8TAG3_9ROSI|nr:hypothetical protein K2173_002222 [Erythroxylum novogranatense]